LLDRSGAHPERFTSIPDGLYLENWRVIECVSRGLKASSRLNGIDAGRHPAFETITAGRQYFVDVRLVQSYGNPAEMRQRGECF
jgi:hypothetical protein